MAKSKPDKEKWERQEKESTKAFEAFKTYRDMGEERSITKVVQSLNKSRALIGDWSSKYNWVERVTAYDDYLDDLDRKSQEKARKKMIERHINESMLLQQKGLEAIKKLNTETTTVNGEKIKNEQLDADGAIQYLTTGMKLERLSRGEPTEIINDNRGQANADGTNSNIERILGDIRATVRTAFRSASPGNGNRGSTATDKDNIS